MKKIVICVTGKIGSGKSTASEILAEILGGKIIDVDKVGHKALEKEEVIERLREIFGENIIKNGKVDRKALGGIVFSDEELLKKLESILHPIMVKMVEEEVKNSEKTIIIDCALLKRMKLDRMCDFIITMKSSYKTSKNRKPQISEEVFRKIWENQKDVTDMGEVIWNELGKEKLEENIIKVLKNHRLYPQEALRGE